MRRLRVVSDDAQQEAEDAAEALRDALAAHDITLPSLDVEQVAPYICGVALVSLGHTRSDVVRAIAALIAKEADR